MGPGEGVWLATEGDGVDKGGFGGIRWGYCRFAAAVAVLAAFDVDEPIVRETYSSSQ